jgi:hypothetical protein
MHPLPPEMLPGVPNVFFTLFKVSFTIAWPNLAAWVALIAVFVAGAGARIPRFIEGKD